MPSFIGGPGFHAVQAMSRPRPVPLAPYMGIAEGWCCSTNPHQPRAKGRTQRFSAFDPQATTVLLGVWFKIAVSKRRLVDQKIWGLDPRAELWLSQPWQDRQLNVSCSSTQSCRYGSEVKHPDIADTVLDPFP